MPIDPSIALGVKPMQGLDILGGAMRGAQLARQQAIAQQEQAQAARQQKLDARDDKEQAEKDQITEIVRRHGGDFAKAMPEINSVNPLVAAKIGESLTKSQKDALEISNLQLAHDEKIVEIGLRELGEAAADPTSWDYVRARIIARNPKAPPPPEVYDPQWVEQKQIAGLNFKDQLAARKKQYQHVNIDVDGQTQVGAFDPSTGQVTPTGTQASTKAEGKTTLEERSLAAFAAKLGKPVDQLTYEDTLKFRKEYQQVDDRARAPRVSVNVGGGGAAGGLTAGEGGGLEYAGTMARLTGRVPIGLSRGGAGPAVINEAARQTKLLGQTPAAAAQKAAAYQGDAKALAQLQKMQATSDAYESKALAQLDIVDSLSDKVGRTSIPLLNRAILAGKTEIAGDADATLLLNAVMTATTEYAKIMAGGTASAAAVTDSAQREAAKLLNPSMSPATLRKATSLMRQEMGLTMQGYKAGINHINERLAGQPAAPTERTGPVVGEKRKFGTKMGEWDGKGWKEVK